MFQLSGTMFVLPTCIFLGTQKVMTCAKSKQDYFSFPKSCPNVKIVTYVTITAYLFLFLLANKGHPMRGT